MRNFFLSYKSFFSILEYDDLNKINKKAFFYTSRSIQKEVLLKGQKSETVSLI